MLPSRTIVCPYCGERFETTVDTSAGDQEYVEDCYVCCRPIVLSITIEDGGRVEITARREND